MKTFNFLDKIKFTSKRSRMSVILKDGEGRIIMYTKGSDNILKPRLKQCKKNEKTYHWLHRYAYQGLRTLLFTAREIKP